MPLRDLLLSLATTDPFRARWSPQIHEEWIRTVLTSNKDNPKVSPQRLERTHDLMDANVLDSVVTGYDDLIDGITLPDANDRHVPAAAIRACADVIVTSKLKHFPDSALRELGIHAEHPDEFVAHLLELNAGAVCLAARQHRARLKNLAVDVVSYLESLQRKNLTETVSRLRSFEDLH